MTISQDFRFAFVSSSSHIAQRVCDYSAARGLRIEIHRASMESAIPVANKLLNEGVDVILGGNGTGRLMRKQLTRPVVTIARTHLDLISALMEARRYSNSIGVTQYDDIPTGLAVLSELLHITLHPIPFTSTQSLVTGISNAIASGVGCIVGGGVCTEIAESKGCPGILCVPGEESLQRALEEAVNIAESLRHERSCRKGKGLDARYRLEDITGETPSMLELKRTAHIYARSDASIFIHGETGTGKERLAHSIHNASPRKSKPFIAVNCAALPETLLESELFGYEEGAFTGSRRGGRDGYFIVANGGTIFLDEVGDLSPAIQVRLLRVIESQEVLRIGSASPVPVDVRILCASNKNLSSEVMAGRFRADLYYRLVTLRLTLPPLRRRTEDLPILCSRILAHLGYPSLALPDGAMEKMQAYDWPGNIRELQTLLRRFTLLQESENDAPRLFQRLLDELQRESPSAPATDSPVSEASKSIGCIRPGLSLKQACSAFEREYILRAIDGASGDRARAAADLGVSVNTLWRKLRPQRDA